MRDFANEIHPMRAISPAAGVADNTAVVSQIVPTKGFQSIVFVLNLGSIADADATFAVTMDEGNDPALADAAAVDASHLTGTLALAGFRFDDDNETRKIGYVGIKDYVRITVTPTNNASAAFISAVALGMGARFVPTPNPPQ